MRAAKCVDRLVVVADRKEARIPSGEQLQPSVLQAVRILEFVDEDVAEALLVVRPQYLVALDQLVGAQQQLGEIDHALGPALLVVRRIEVHEAARLLVGDMHVRRAQPLFLLAVDEGLHFARRKAILVRVQSLQHALDGRELVLRVENLEGLRQAGIAVVEPQHAVGKAVKRPDPHPAQVDRQHRREPREHLARRLVGERDREHGAGRNLLLAHEPRNARREHARLAAAGAGKNQRMPLRQGDGR